MSRSKLVMVVIGVAAWASIAQAAAVVELSALSPENATGGYLPGTTVDFEVAISTDWPYPIYLRGLTLDFSQSSPELVFTGPDDWPLDPAGNPMGNGHEEFVFDFSSVPSGGMYWQFPDYPLANMSFSGTGGPNPNLVMLKLPEAGAGSLVAGHGTVVLPQDAPMYSEFIVDALNASAPERSWGARIDFDFGNPQMWHANPSLGDDVITGDPLLLTVVPEPGTLVLLVAGGLVGLTRLRARS